MKKTTFNWWVGVAFLALFSTMAQAQALKTPVPSPLQTTKQNFALGDVTIEYSRPSAKGRTVYGDLVPYGKIWRTGANASTKLTFSDDVKLEGKAVKAGTYALYTIPSKDSWEVLLYSDLSLGGNVTNYKTENEVIRFTVKPTTLANAVETFTINLANVEASQAVLEILWDKTRVPVKVSADIDDRVMKNIESVLLSDNRPYFQAAAYYYENGKDLNQALTWINKAVEQNPKAFWIQLYKARIELKLKDNNSAIASAEKTIAMAKEAKNDDYVKMAEQLIAEAKGKKK
jgi:tetratricopeptide (TPR) repeat protein